MKFIFFSAAVLLFLVLSLASPLPREASFYIILLSFFYLPKQQSTALALGGGFLTDLFSPVPGLSVLAYPCALLLAAFLERHIASRYSLFGFLVLFFALGGVVALMKTTLFFLAAGAANADYVSLGMRILDARFLILRSLALDVLLVLALYGISVCVDRNRRTALRL